MFIISYLLLIFQVSLVFPFFPSVSIERKNKAFLEIPYLQNIEGKSDLKPLPESFINATNRLYEQGLPDVRKGEYCEIEITPGSVWGGAENIKIHGWLLPQSNKEGERIAVGWNGVIYPVVSVGEKANLRADILELIKADEDLRSRQKNENPNFPFHRIESATPNGFSASHKSLLPIKASILLRLKEKELAAKVWDAWNAGIPNNSNDIYWKDPYLMLARSWVWSLFDYAVTAQMRGDDKASLSNALKIASTQSSIENEAAKRKFILPGSISGEKPHYLNFLQPLSALLADQERRAAVKKPSTVSVSEIASYSDKNKRIAALIEKLDEVSARQWGQPGGVDVGSDPIVSLLIAQGEDAVEPLLQVIETDERLTRSVSFHRNFFYHRHLISVAEVAYTTLRRILKTDSFGTPTENLNISNADGRKNLVRHIRNYLTKYGKSSIEERWYSILLDDKASREDWNQATANIIAPRVYDGEPPAWVFTSTPAFPPQSTAVVILQGIPLRKKMSPSVSQLFTKRMLELSQIREDGGNWQNLSVAANLAMALLIWEGAEQLSAVREFHELLKNKYRALDEKDISKRSQLRSLITSLFLKRFEVNDEKAFVEYAEWIGGMKPEDAGENTIYLLTPIWRFANHPIMQKVSADLFEDANSRWLPIIDKENRASFDRAKLLETPMLNVKNFRERVIEGLKNKSVVGTLRRQSISNGEARYELIVENTYTAVLLGASNAAGSTRFKLPDDDIRVAHSAESIEIRACDVFASKLTIWKDAPKFRYYWTEAERDRAIKEFIKFLSEHQGEFKSLSGFYK